MCVTCFVIVTIHNGLPQGDNLSHPPAKDCKELRDRGKGWEDEMVGWHHWLHGLESEQTPGVADGQGSLACCSPWGRKESDRTEWLNWIKGSKMNTFSCLRLAILGDICKDWIVFLPCFLTSLEVIHHLCTHLLWIWQPGPEKTAILRC